MFVSRHVLATFIFDRQKLENAKKKLIFFVVFVNKKETKIHLLNNFHILMNFFLFSIVLLGRRPLVTCG